MQLFPWPRAVTSVCEGLGAGVMWCVMLVCCVMPVWVLCDVGVGVV